jgi:hypothetical protein
MKSPEGAKDHSERAAPQACCLRGRWSEPEISLPIFLPSFQGWSDFVADPGLAPWAAFFRRFAADSTPIFAPPNPR